jgi:hypothetical protein
MSELGLHMRKGWHYCEDSEEHPYSALRDLPNEQDAAACLAGCGLEMQQQP